MEDLNSVQKFYEGKTVFITGASGFMGKVLMEKILYSCSGVKEVIILMRGKRGQSARERVNKFKEIELFQRILNEKPEMMDKIFPVWGDITKPDFEMNEEHFARVVENTQIVFHMAASLKLEAPLKENVMINLFGTKNALELSKKMKNLLQFVHLSTAFCNVEPEVCEEKIYDCDHNPEDLMQMATWMNNDTMTEMQKTLMGGHANTYTYTKRLAEILVSREYKNLPVSIARPTIVMPATQEPLPGWVDSLNGVVGVMYAAGKGVLRSMLVDPKAKFEFIPVDIAINAIVLIPKLLTESERWPEIPVYHLTIHEKMKIQYGKMLEMLIEVGRKYPVSWALWHPNGSFTMNPYVNGFKIFMFQLVPAYVIDALLFIFRQKRFMVRVQNRIAQGSEVLKFFTMRQWQFQSDNFQAMIKQLSPNEYKMFMIDTVKFIGHEHDYIKDCILGGRQYCVKDPLTTLPMARRMAKIQYVIHVICKLLFYWYAITYLLKAFGLFEPLKDLFVATSQKSIFN